VRVACSFPELNQPLKRLMKHLPMRYIGYDESQGERYRVYLYERNS